MSSASPGAAASAGPQMMVRDRAKAGTPAFEGRAGYERFQDEAVIPRLFEMSADADRFHGRLTPFTVGPVTLIDYDMTAARYSRTAERARRDGVDHVWVQLIEAGGLVGWSLDRKVAMAAGAAGLCDFSVATEQVSLPSRGVALLIPRDAFPQAEIAGLHGGATRGPRFTLLNDHVAWLRAAGPLARASAGARAATALASVVAACLDPRGRPSEEAVPLLGTAASRRIRAYVAANLDRAELDAAEIARAVGVSRSTLYRLCEPQGGVAEMLWALRLGAARRMLTDPAQPGRIGDIAYACGFSSLPHFSRRFRDRYGFSPSDLRPF